MKNKIKKMIKDLTVVHTNFKEEQFYFEGVRVNYQDSESYQRVNRCIKYIVENMFKFKETKLLALKQSEKALHREIFNDTMRVCPGGIIQLANKVIDYELTIIYKNIFNTMKENNIIIFKLTQEELIEYILKILSIVFIVINYASDSTLGNNYELKYFKRAITQLENIDKEYSKLNQFSSKHIPYSFEFLERINYKISDYILKFMKHKPTFDDASDSTWFHEDPFCWYMTNNKCCYCSKHLF